MAGGGFARLVLPKSDEKAPLRRDGTGRAVVRLMPEYLVELPLGDQDWRAVHLEPPRFSALADWQQRFDDHFMPAKGWADTAVRDQWAQRQKCSP